MWHSHLNDMEILETKRFIPKGFELGSTYSVNNNGTELEQVVHTHRISCLSSWPILFGALNPNPPSEY